MLSVEEAAPGSYYGSAINYYAKDALVQPEWFGRGAEALGLTGQPFSTEDYDRLYEGILPSGETLGRMINNVREHEAGWDHTWSVPKSVSLMALVGGDRRLIDAVGEAAKIAMTMVEKDLSISRFTENGKTIPRVTGNIVAAMFMHDLSRAGQPQLHVHFPLLNMTQGPDGRWRSLDGRVFYDGMKERGVYFQDALAFLVRNLGHDIEVNAKNGTFEIAGFTRALLDNFSKRRLDILAHLEAKGLTEATPLQAKIAARTTRPPKDKDFDKALHAEVWHRIMAEHGMNLKGMIDNAKARAGDPAYHQGNQTKMRDEALGAVRTAAQILAEKNIAFKDVDLIRHAATQAQGRAERPAIREAIRELDKQGFLQARELPHYDRVSGDHIKVQGWTTSEAIKIETETLDHERDGRGIEKPMLKAVAALAVSKDAGEQVSYWNADHQKTLFGLLTSKNRVVAVDAPLGSETARHVVGSFLNTATNHGFDVRLMTPSAGGVAQLTSLMEAPATTIASHLWSLKREPAQEQAGMLERIFNPKRGEVWLVGDAARLRPSATLDLLKAAADQEARVVLMDQSHEGKTFGSRSFEQLRDAGMMTFKLPEQQGPNKDNMRLAVAAFAQNEPALAFDYIRKAGGQIIAIAAGSRTIPDTVAAMHERRRWIADRYADLTPGERAKTRVFELTNRGKEALNSAIRKELLDKGDLSGPAVTAEVLIAKSMSDTERKQAYRYSAADIVRFGSGYQRQDQPEITGGEYLRVHEVQAEDGKLILEKADGRQVTWEPGSWGAENSATYRAAKRDLAIGERIVWTRSDRSLGVANQQRETIVSVEPERGSISVERDNKVVSIDLARAKHLDYAYAELVQSQLIPAERVIAHVPAENTALTNLEMLARIALQSAGNDVTFVTEDPARLSQAAEDRRGQAPAALDYKTAASGASFDALRISADILAERNAIFSDKDLRELARKQGLGTVPEDELNKAIREFEHQGELIPRIARIYDRGSHTFTPGPGWATLDAIGNEEKMLTAERRGRGAFSGDRILSEREAVKFVRGAEADSPADKPWNADQRQATAGLLSSPHLVTGLQGLAGAAKTSYVIVTLAKVAELHGHKVIPMAQTTTAALKLGKDLKDGQVRNAEGRTVAKHLGAVSRVKPPDADKAPIWIADEAALVGSRDMRDLVRAAEQHGARLFLVFDVLQLSSVAAGRAASQLIENGMKTHYLSEIVRQSDNLKMREAVYDAIARQPAQALEHLELAGGQVLEFEKEGDRFKAIAKEFMSHPPDDREKTIIVSPTRDNVDGITKQIRKLLGAAKVLTGKDFKATHLRDAGMTRPEIRTSINYQQGLVVRFPQEVKFGDQGTVARGSYLVVDSVGGAEVRLREENGKRTFLWEPRDKPLTVEVYEQKQLGLKKGEWIRWNRSVAEIGAISGERATVIAVDRDNNRIDVRNRDGSERRLDLTNRDHQGFELDYVKTAIKAQGITGPVIVDAASKHLNTVHDALIYVGLSRTPDTATIVTDNRGELIKALRERSGYQPAALDAAYDAGKAAIKTVRDMAATKLAEITKVASAKEQTMTPELTKGGGGRGMEM